MVEVPDGSPTPKSREQQLAERKAYLGERMNETKARINELKSKTPNAYSPEIHQMMDERKGLVFNDERKITLTIVDDADTEAEPRTVTLGAEQVYYKGIETAQKETTYRRQNLTDKQGRTPDMKFATQLINAGLSAATVSPSVSEVLSEKHLEEAGIPLSVVDLTVGLVNTAARNELERQLSYDTNEFSQLQA